MSDDVTRLAPSAGAQPTEGAASGWLASSGAIDHGRIATAMAVNQALQIAPLTLDLTKPHALASSIAILAIGSLAAYAFAISRAGGGLLRRLVPAA